MENPESPTGDEEAERAELREVLSSKIFTRARSLGKLLSYLCDKYFAGEADQIKEYTIAVEFFQKMADFNSQENPIVRVEASRLRVKLKEYYRTEGTDHPIQISVASGHYVPVFQHRRKKAQPAGKDNGSGLPEESSDTNQLDEVLVLSKEEQEPEPEGEPVPDAAATPLASVSSGRPPAIRVAALSLAGVVLIAAGITWLPRVLRRAPALAAPATASPGAPQSISYQNTDAGVRIVAGSKVARYVDPFGMVWTGDRYYTGGDILTPPPSALQRAENSHLCRQAREGDFEYAIPLNPGIYELHIYFAEIQYGFEPEEGGETTRIFHVYANGKILLDSLDVFSDAGGGGKVDERIFTDVSPAKDGKLRLAFKSARGKAFVNGLEVVPGIPGRMHTVRLTTRSTPYLSPDQQLWQPDCYYHGGRTVVRLNPVEAPRDPELYQSERYGNFSYTIPVAKGRYNLKLKFAETYFGSSNPLHVGPQRRLFDVYCNGQTLLKDFEIAKEAGGVNRALDKVFHGLQPNAQGKLVLTFLPVVNYACINAIEVVPE
jgi:hypothetical protein